MTTILILILTTGPASLSSVSARAPQQAANATNDGQAERIAFWVAQRALTPFHVRCVTHWQA
jgi:hypothetical protein